MAAYLTAALVGGAAAPAAAGDSLITVIDNSHADSVVEIDRSANLQTGSGTAGSDHEGSAADTLATLIEALHASRAGPAGPHQAS
ncbi:hypothetical protein EF918_08635 [Streptomyces sp. WAC06614]|nr:hypothetical protein EF918_08635 [Streptomyces sp. WAC06614]